MKRDISGLRTKLRSDSRCRRLRRLFQELPIYQIPAEDLTKEIERIHKARAIRFLSSSDPKFLDAVVNASVRDQSDRSRLAEISMQCYKAESTLKRAVDAVREHLLIVYSTDLSFVRTKDERADIVNMALAPFIKFIDKVQRVSTLADIVIKDIDKGAFTLRLYVDSYKLHNAPERTI